MSGIIINGNEVLSIGGGSSIRIETGNNRSLRFIEEGADTITLQTENGDITLVASGTGNIELNAPIQIEAGNKILSSDGNAIVFGRSIDVEGDVIVEDVATIGEVLKLEPQGTLPAGELGMLGVSGSDLYFHNGTSWIQK